MMDERNFHCWNYRLMTSLIYLKEIERRVTSSEELSTSTQIDFLKKECEMAERLIKKNFSNYSAWHYRSKLLPEMYQRISKLGKTESVYLIPFEKIQEDLALLKHAFFTDPKD